MALLFNLRMFYRELNGAFADVVCEDGKEIFSNAVIISTSVVAAGLVVNSLAGYALSRLRFRGRSALLAVIVALTIIPLEAVAVPLLFLVNGWGWRDTYQVQILPFVANPLFVYLFYTFFLDVPREIEEAALIDGAGPIVRFRKIIVPIIAPVLFVGSLYDLVFTLNDMTIVYLLTRGGPGDVTHVLSSYAFLLGVQSGALGRGAAVALLLFPILLVIVFFALRALKRRDI